MKTALRDLNGLVMAVWWEARGVIDGRELLRVVMVRGRVIDWQLIRRSSRVVVVAVAME